MIQLRNLTKEYTTKNKNSVRALDDVNLTFPEKGLCLVLGKSGCGKTTLLNILGGLDVKYKGDYVFLDKKLQSKDFSDFRKNYVSFVFQDFNLIEDLDVSENLSIGYNFAAKDCTQQLSSALVKVGLEDYEYRFPQELSGGEQQRVAIARALLKDSKLLLADEPTGNLDKENSEEIYKILKEISQEKLVIVVSHDEQLGREYADYVVRLDEGRVVENDMPQTESSGHYAKKNTRAIRNKIACQMAWYEFTRKKGRSIAAVIALVICFSLISFALPLWEYNPADPHYNLIKKQGYSRILIGDLSCESYDSLLDDGVRLSLCNNVGFNGDVSNLVFQSKEEAESHGIKLYECENELPLRADTYYISDKYLEQLIKYGNNKAEINGVEVELNMEDYALTDIVGGRLDAMGYSRTCAGVYYASRIDKETDIALRYEDEYYGDYITTELGGERYTLFVKSHYGDYTTFLSSDASAGCILSDEGMNSKFDHIVLDDQGNVEVFDKYAHNNILSDEGIYVSLGVFNDIFGTDYETSSIVDITESGYSVKLIPEYLGERVSIEVVNRDLNRKNTMADLVVKGIVLDFSSSRDRAGIYEYASIWFSSQQDLLKYNMLVHRFSAWADVSSIRYLRGDMRSMCSDYGCTFYSPVRSAADYFEKTQLSGLVVSTKFVAIALSIVVLLAMALLITGQILSRKREIGIFKALGAKGRDIGKIYIFETLFIAVPTAILSIILSICGTVFMNSQMSRIVESPHAIISYAWFNAPLTMVVILALFALGTAIPLLRIDRFNVIDSIRQKAGK